MAFQKKIKTLFRVIDSNIRNAQHPVFAEIRLTYKCNMACKYCNIWSIKKKEMDTDQVKYLIDKLSSKGCIFIQITGGEPLLRKDIFHIIDYIKGRGMKVNLITNGILLNEENIKKIKKIDMISISLDGREEVHDEQRGKGSYRKAINAVRTAKKNGIKTLILTTISKYNIKEKDFIIQFCKKHNTMWFFQFVMDYPLAKQNRSSISFEEKESFIHTIIKEVNPKILFTSKEGLKEYLINKKNNEIKCHAGKLFVAIEPEGNVIPCCIGQNIINPLNFLEVGFEKAFEKTRKHSCQRCIIPLIEYNRYLSLKPTALKQLSKILKQEEC